MSAYFLDTSALAKRYINEVGTKWIRGLTRASAGNVIVIAELATLEIFSVFARREYDKEITAASANRLRATFLAHLRDEYLTIQVDPLWVQSRDLVTKHAAHRLRSLDALQLACAMQARTNLPQTITLLSADPRLQTAALAEGFAVDDPLAYR